MAGELAEPISHARFAPGATTLVLGRRGLLLLSPGVPLLDALVPVVLDGAPGFAVVVAQHMVSDPSRAPFAVVEFDTDAPGATVLVRGDIGLVAVVGDETITLEASAFATWREHRLPGATSALVIGQGSSTLYSATAPSVLPVMNTRIPIRAAGDSARPEGHRVADPSGGAPTRTEDPGHREPPAPLLTQAGANGTTETPGHAATPSTVTQADGEALRHREAPAPPATHALEDPAGLSGDRVTSPPIVAAPAPALSGTSPVSGATGPPDDGMPPPGPTAGPAGHLAVAPVSAPAFGLLDPVALGPAVDRAASLQPSVEARPAPAASGRVPSQPEPPRTPYDFAGRPPSPFAAPVSPVEPAVAPPDLLAEDAPTPAREFQTTAIGPLRDQLAEELRTADPAAGDGHGRTITRPAGPRPAGPDPVPPRSASDPAAGPRVRAKTCACGQACDPLTERCDSCGVSLAGRPVVTGPPPVIGRLRLDDGQEVPLLGPLTLGRKPPSNRSVGGVIATPVTVADPEQRISLFHLEVRVEEWTVSIVDYGSTNHTWVTLPEQNAVRLRANQPFTIIPGTTVDLGGQRSFAYLAGAR